jgi:hypothetical protein
MIEPEKFVRALDRSKECDDKRELNNRWTHTPQDARSFLIVPPPSRHSALSVITTHGTKQVQVLGLDSLVINNTPRSSMYIPPFANVPKRWDSI